MFLDRSVKRTTLSCSPPFTPRINLSTIHGVKGGEQDNVVLLTDLSRNTQRNYENNPDDENRLFYVGATRTKSHLHIIRPKDIYKGYKI